jgi:GNAT superfamily N-acetyltransferase
MGGEAIDVRAATRGDVEALVACNLGMAQETEGVALDAARLRRGVEAVFEDPARGFYLVAEAGGQVAGALMITYEWSDWRNGVFWWIQSVYVLPAFRRRGVFRAMHEHLVRTARASREVCGIRLYVHRANAAARQTYQALGMIHSHYEMYEIDFVLG